MKTSVTFERVRELLEYDAQSGVFTWRVSRGRVKAGANAGTLTRHGYLSIHIDGQGYLAHRLAWVAVHGEFPQMHLDHIDGCRTNNRMTNLREVTRAENQQNQRKAKRNNRCGLLGVSQKRGRWRAQIIVGGRAKHLGMFNTDIEAHIAYLLAKRAMHSANTL